MLGLICIIASLFAVGLIDFDVEDDHSESGTETDDGPENDDNSVILHGSDHATLARQDIADFIWQDSSGNDLGNAPTSFRGSDGGQNIVISGFGIEVTTGQGADRVDLSDSSQVLLRVGTGDVVMGSNVLLAEDVTVIMDGAGAFYGGTAAERGIAVGDNASLRGGAGEDTLESDQGASALFGGDGDDILMANQTGMEFRSSATRGIFDFIDTSSDSLFGGLGNDQLILAEMDHATGGVGQDSFLVYSNGNNGEPATINDYCPEEDVLTVFVGNDDQDGSSDTFQDLIGIVSVEEVDGNSNILYKGAEVLCIKNLTGFSVGFMHHDSDGTVIFTDLAGEQNERSSFDVIVSRFPSVST